MPAVLSLASLSGVVVARLWLVRLTWLLLPLSVVLIGRALWLTLVRRRGMRWTRRLTCTSAVLTIALWSPRLWTWLS